LLSQLEAGWVLGAITLLVMTVFSIFAANMIVVTIARADTSYKLITASASHEELCNVNSNDNNTNDIDIHSIDWNGYQSINKKTSTNNDNNKTKFSIGIDGSYDEYDEHIDDIDQDDINNRINSILGPSSSSSSSKLSMVGDRKFEIPELCEMFLGIRGRDAYMVTIVLYLYGTCKRYHHHHHYHYHYHHNYQHHHCYHFNHHYHHNNHHHHHHHYHHYHRHHHHHYHHYHHYHH